MGTSKAKTTNMQQPLKEGGRKWSQLESGNRKAKDFRLILWAVGGGGGHRKVSKSDLVRYESWRDNVHGDTEVN